MSEVKFLNIFTSKFVRSLIKIFISFSRSFVTFLRTFSSTHSKTKSNFSRWRKSYLLFNLSREVSLVACIKSKSKSYISYSTRINRRQGIIKVGEKFALFDFFRLENLYFLWVFEGLITFNYNASLIYFTLIIYTLVKKIFIFHGFFFFWVRYYL